MANTKIEWADKVWNPITGCTPISEGCRHCYAKRMAQRLKGRYGYPADDPFRVTFHLDRLNDPLRWKKPCRIFVCSMADFFHDDIDPDWQIRILDTLYHYDVYSKHIAMFLTKRPKNIIPIMENWRKCNALANYPKKWWFGVTTENQATANERISILLQIPAAIRWVSVEPMLENINILKHNLHSIRCKDYPSASLGLPMSYAGQGKNCECPKIDWVVAGPETGPGARPCPPGAIENLYEQCRAAGVPFFDKRLDYLAREFPA